MKKKFKDLKEGDILWFVEGTTIKETTINNLRIEDFTVYSEKNTEERWITKPHYHFNTYIGDEFQYDFRYAVDEYENDTDTAMKYDGYRDYSYFCHFLNKEDAIKRLKKNIKEVLKEKRNKFKEIKTEISFLKHQLATL